MTFTTFLQKSWSISSIMLAGLVVVSCDDSSDQSSKDDRSFTTVFVCADDSGRNLHESMSSTLASAYRSQGSDAVARIISGGSFRDFCMYDGNRFNGDFRALGDPIRSLASSSGEGVYLFRVTPTSIVAINAYR